ncbi:COQ9 family protein [Kiloniella antarctica]|uniref:COQ9 family protein n=1 Tax=Kiloniella antarctica TaxID=1550907 RepID=A0ABW5BF27_9PROT
MSDKQKDKLLDALLPVVPFEGWSDSILMEIGASCELSSQKIAILFPRGMTDILRYFNKRLDTHMMGELEKRDLDNMKVRERITLAVRIRLELMEPHREAVRKGMSFFVMPLKASEGMHNLYDTVDAMWLAAGDKSTDYNFYSKRLLLSGVYSSTMLFWLEDKSEGYEKTWNFLDRRIAEVLKIGGALGKSIGKISSVADRLRSLSPFSKEWTGRC